MTKHTKIPKFVHNCDYCNNNFEKMEEIYLIANFILERSPADGDLHWRNVKNMDKIKKVEKWFHRDCFKAIAGRKFIGEEK